MAYSDNLNVVKDRVVCIYHGGNCLDGFTSAWIVRNFFKNNSDIALTFVAAQYTDLAPMLQLKDATVLIVDFSYSAEVIREIAQIAKHVTIIDHHVSAINALKDADLGSNVDTVFSLSHSGAALTAMHLFPVDSLPPLVSYVEDRDLWRKALPDTEEISAALFSRPLTFDEWDKISVTPFEQLASEGKSLLRVRKSDIGNLVTRACVTGTIAGYEVPIVNAPWFFGSDSCHLLLERNLRSP